MAFALGRKGQALCPLIAAAEACGELFVLIIESPAYAFGSHPDDILADGPGGDGELRTFMAPKVMVYAPQLAPHHLEPKRYLGVREGIDDLTRLAGGGGEVPLRRP